MEASMLITLGVLLYVLVALWQVLWGLDSFNPQGIGSGLGTNRKGATLILLAPIWPVWILVGLWHYFTHIIPMLWKEARG